MPSFISLSNKPTALLECAQTATKSIASNGEKHSRHATSKTTSLVAAAVLVLAGCAAPPSGPPLPLYRCEYGIEFTAKFIDDSVALDSTRGYDVLYRGGKHTADPKNLNEYANARMSAEFKLGATGREAVLRYPLLPLVTRCVRD